MIRSHRLSRLLLLASVLSIWGTSASALTPTPDGQVLTCIVLHPDSTGATIDYSPVSTSLQQIGRTLDVTVSSEWQYSTRQTADVTLDSLVKDRDGLISAFGGRANRVAFKLDATNSASGANFLAPKQSNCSLLLLARVPGLAKPCGPDFGSVCKLKCEGNSCKPFHWVDGEFSWQRY